MGRSSLVAVATGILASAMGGQAFAPTCSGGVRQRTSLQAMPPMIIGPMIKKMRENNAKKNAPLASDDEARMQAQGLRVGGAAWKWPPVWPYEADIFKPEQEIVKQDPTSQLGAMAGMLQGMPQAPTPDEAAAPEIERLDPLNYWGEEVADKQTELDPEAIEKIKA